MHNDTQQIANTTGMPADAVQRLIGASEANVAASGALQTQMQQFQQASVRGQQLQTEALLRQLGEAAQAQAQQNLLLQQVQTSLANAAPGAPQPATPPAVVTQELAAFMGGAVSNTVREVAHNISAMTQQSLREAAQGHQTITQNMFQPLMDYIRNLPPQNQIFQYFNHQNQFAMINLNQLIDNSRRLRTTVNVDARQQTINVMLQEVVNILHAQRVPVNRETVNNVLEQMTGSNLEALGDPPLPPPQEPPTDMPFDPLNPLQAQSFVVPNIENMLGPQSLLSPSTIPDVPTETVPSPAEVVDTLSSPSPAETEAETEAGYSDEGCTAPSRLPPNAARLPPKATAMPPPRAPPKAQPMPPKAGRVPIRQQGKAPPTEALAAQAVAVQTLARAENLAKHRQQPKASWSRPFGETSVVDDLEPPNI